MYDGWLEWGVLWHWKGGHYWWWGSQIPWGHKTLHPQSEGGYKNISPSNAISEIIHVLSITIAFLNRIMLYKMRRSGNLTVILFSNQQSSRHQTYGLLGQHLNDYNIFTSHFHIFSCVCVLLSWRGHSEAKMSTWRAYHVGRSEVWLESMGRMCIPKWTRKG